MLWMQHVNESAARFLRGEIHGTLGTGTGYAQIRRRHQRRRSGGRLLIHKNNARYIEYLRLLVESGKRA